MKSQQAEKKGKRDLLNYGNPSDDDLLIIRIENIRWCRRESCEKLRGFVNFDGYL